MANPLTLLYVALKDGVPSIVLHAHFPVELMELVSILPFSQPLRVQTNLVPGMAGCSIQLIAPILLHVFWLPHHAPNARKLMELGLKNHPRKPKALARVIACIHWPLNHIGPIGKHVPRKPPVKAKVVRATIILTMEVAPGSV